jgi:hypothetical protein
MILMPTSTPMTPERADDLDAASEENQGTGRRHG